MRTAVKVPTHMNMADRVVFGLTARQLLILLIGCSAGYDLYLQLHGLVVLAAAGMLIRLGVASVPALLALVFALLAIEGRPLEIWLFILIRYWQRPQYYVWCSVRCSGDQQGKGGGRAASPEAHLPARGNEAEADGRERLE